MQLICNSTADLCLFFAYAKSRFSHETTHISLYTLKTLLQLPKFGTELSAPKKEKKEKPKSETVKKLIEEKDRERREKGNTRNDLVIRRDKVRI